MSVTLSAGTRSSLLALQQISALMALSQTRLATGKRVNSALDDPNNFFTASALNSRASQLNQLVDTAAGAQKTIEAAANGINAIEALIQSAQTAANNALQSTATNAKVTGTVTGLTGASSITISVNKTITVNDGTTTATYTADLSPTVQEFLDAVNNTSGLKVRANLTSDGRIELDALSTNNVVIGGTSNGGEKASIGLVAGTTTGTLNSTRQALALQFDQIRTQIDQAITDAGYSGVNLLAGNNLSVIFNEDGSSKLDVAGVTYSSAVLGLPIAGSGTGYQFQSNTEINAALKALTAALSTVSNQALLLESQMSIVNARQDFNTALTDLLKTGADDLVLADSNEESAALLALRARQDLATTTLSIAGESDRSVLLLFGIK
jgi:flagellin-like hook-associated protein FlgL